ALAQAIRHLAVQTCGDHWVEFVLGAQRPGRSVVILVRRREGLGAVVNVTDLFEGRQRHGRFAALGFLRIVAIATQHELPLSVVVSGAATPSTDSGFRTRSSTCGARTRAWVSTAR